MSGFRNDTFDDRDTEHLKYQGRSWFLAGFWNASNVGKTGTLSSTNGINDTVTFTFPEPAIAFYYFGIPRCCGGQYGICIDCDPNKPNFKAINAVNRTDDGHNPPIVLFSQRFDTLGVHQIVIKNEPDLRFSGGSSQLTVDRILLEVPDPSAGSSSSLSSSSSSSSSLSSLTSFSTSTSSSPSMSTVTSASPPVGAIVGGILGALAFLFVIPTFWIRMRRRRAPMTGGGAIRSNGVYRTHSVGQRQPAFILRFLSSLSSSPSVPTSSFAMSRIPNTASARNPSRHAPAVEPRRERDAGPALFMEEAEADGLPPAYDDVVAPNRWVSAAQQRGGGEGSAGVGGSGGWIRLSAFGGFSRIREKM